MTAAAPKRRPGGRGYERTHTQIAPRLTCWSKRCGMCGKVSMGGEGMSLRQGLGWICKPSCAKPTA